MYFQHISQHVTDDFFADQGMSLEAQLHQPVSLTRNKRSQHAVQNGLLFSAFKRTFLPDRDSQMPHASKIVAAAFNGCMQDACYS